MVEAFFLSHQQAKQRPDPRELRGNPSEEWWKSILPLHRLLPSSQQQQQQQDNTLNRFNSIILIFAATVAKTLHLALCGCESVGDSSLTEQLEALIFSSHLIFRCESTS